MKKPANSVLRKAAEASLHVRGYVFDREENGVAIWRSAGMATAIEARVKPDGKTSYREVPLTEDERL